MKTKWIKGGYHIKILGVLVLFFSVMTHVVGMDLEPMRPHTTTTAISSGVEIVFDFRHLNSSQWQALLETPEEIHLTGYGFAGQAGEPALPQFTELIPVRSSTLPTLVASINDDYTLEMVELKQTPQPHRETDPISSVNDFQSDHSKENIEYSVHLGDAISMRDQLYLPVTIKPLGLDLANSLISIPEKITLQIQGVEADRGSEEAFVHRSVFPEEDLYHELGHYLIITPPLFENYLEYLVDWKRRKGHPVTVVSTLDAGSSPTAIKAYIQEAYDTWADPPRYILLIGDEDRGIGGFYVYNPDNEALVTDHPYALLEGDDSFPEAWVGRLSVDTIGELMVLIRKILSYESQPYMDDSGWYKRALMVGTITAAISTQHVNNWVTGKLIENGFTQVDTAYYPMQSSLSHISDPINNGVGYVNYRGLGAWDHWIGPYFYNADINYLHNGHMLPILTSIVCGGGNFAAPVDPVFGEKWIRAGTTSNPKGAVAFIGPSEVHTHTQFNNVIDIALYSALFDLGMDELGPALWYAKLELWRNYYQSEYLPFGQSAEFYQNVYNILGDPGMQVWTDTPQLITIDAPDTLHRREDHILLTVQDLNGIGIPGAFVYLHNSENGTGLYTDVNGRVSLPFQSGLETELLLTVTGKNLAPILKTIAISTENSALSYHQWEIAQEGLLMAGSTAEMNISLINHAEDITNLTLRLSSQSPHCQILDSTRVLEFLGADDRITITDMFSIQVSEDTQHGEMIDFDLEVDTGAEILFWQKRFPVQAPWLEIDSLHINELDFVAGDAITFKVDVLNKGGVSCAPMILTLQDQTLAWSTENSVAFPEIHVDESIRSDDEFTLNLSDQIFSGEILNLIFVCAYGDQIDTLFAPLKIERVHRFSPSAPDGYGYRVYDEMDVSYSLAPVYDWIEIDPTAGGNGFQLPLVDEEEEADEVAFLELPFPVNYYGQSYDEITVCTNGWIAMGHTTEVNFYNRVIPSPEGPNAMIAPFWDDLTTNPGGVFYQDMGDSLVIEWSGVNNLSINANLSFQVIIYSLDSYPTLSEDNQIKIQYKNYSNYDTFASFSTVGIESPNYTTGLQVSFDNIQDPSIVDMYSGRALLFTTDRATRLPGAEMTLDQQGLEFSLNPWSTATDSIGITNNGGSPLVYFVSPEENSIGDPAPNPLAGLDLVKGGPEPSGSVYSQNTRDFDDYEWTDQESPGGPVFQWMDISQEENRLDYQFDPDDSFIGPLEIGFNFPFYTELYTSLNFSSNGTISFVSQEYPWNNLTLPNSAAPAALVAPWWDDLNNNDGVQGVPYFWSNQVDTAVVTWKNFKKFGTNDSHTFQVILVSNGDIFFQYQEMQGEHNVSTVGIQNVTKNKGLQIYFNSPNGLGPGDVIRIRRLFNWLTVPRWSGVVLAGETDYFTVNVDTRNLEPNTFAIPLSLGSNDTDMLTTELTINLNVVHGTPPIGDINIDYQVNILDITTMIEYILELEIPGEAHLDQMDLNGDDKHDVLDVLQLIELIL